MKLQQAGDGCEGAFREEGERIAVDGVAQHASCVCRPSISIEPLYEMRAEAAQQQSRKRHAVHLPLDDEGKLRRKRSREHHAVEVARVVRDHHALARGQLVSSFHSEPHARQQKERARHRAGNRAPPPSAGKHEHQDEGAQAQQDEQHNRVDPIEESERGQER